MTPTSILYDLAGSPPVDSCEETMGRCYVCCADMTRGMPVQKWLGSNYTDQNRARWPSATHVCEACCHIHAWTSPPGRMAAPGKARGPSWRGFSHLWEDGWGYRNANKAEKPAIREFIEREHAGDWFAAIADTGQKHVIPFTPMNGSGRAGLVLMDELRVQVPDDTSLIARMADLDTLMVMIGAFLADCKVGGKKATGHGRLRCVKAWDMKVARPSEAGTTMDPTALGGRVGSLFRDHVTAHKKQVRDWLKSVNA